MCKSLSVMEQEFQTQLMKHAGALLKLQDMVHCSLDLREVIEKSTPDVLYCEKVKKTATAAAATPETQTPGKIDGGFGMSPPAKKPAAEDAPPAKKLKKPSKKIKLNTTDCLANDII